MAYNKKNDKKEQNQPEQQSKGTDELGPDDLIERIIPDPNDRDVKRLVGFRLGRSNRDDFHRLYLTANLDEYVEFRKTDAIDGQLFPDGSGHMCIWIRPDTRLHFVRIKSHSAKFLEGNIQRRFLRGTRNVASWMAAAALRRDDPNTLCICEPGSNRTQECPGDSCGLCAGTFSDCPGGGGGYPV
jgi:hypothetical protein